MELVAGIALSAVLAVAIVLAWQLRRRPRLTARHRSTNPVAQVIVPARPAEPLPSPEPVGVIATAPYAGLPSNHLIVGPPIVADLGVGLGEPVPLRDWLVHYHPARDNVWAEVVAEFYATAASDPEVADYFTDLDLATLQKHFLAALMMLTGHGLTVGVIRQMQTRHAQVRNSRGEPITPEVYDAAIGVLVGILRARGVSGEVLGQLAQLLSPLREVIVVGVDSR